MSQRWRLTGTPPTSFRSDDNDGRLWGLGPVTRKFRVMAALVLCKVERAALAGTPDRLRAFALDDLEFEVDDAAAQMVGSIHDATEQHLRRAFADVVARQAQCRDGRRNVPE